MKRLPPPWITAWILAHLLPISVATKDRKDRLRNLQLEGEDDCVSTTNREFFLVELLGTPAMVTTTDLGSLETSFVGAVMQDNQNTTCAYTSMNVAVWNEAIAGAGQDIDAAEALEMDDPLEDRLQETFSYMIMVEYEQCLQSQEECIQVSMVRGNNNGGNRQRSLRQTQEATPACGCDPMPLDDLLQAWNGLLSSNVVSEVVDMTPLQIVNDCDSNNYTKFSSTLHLDLMTSTGTLTDLVLTELSEIVLKTYNELNLLNAESCDPHRRQILGVAAESTSIVDMEMDDIAAPNTVVFYVTGLCLDCNTDTNLFHSTISEAQRRMQGQDEIVVDMDATCLCPEDALLLRPPTVDEYELSLISRLLPLSSVESVVTVEEKDPLSCTGEIVEFQKVVPIQYDVICELFEDDIPSLELTYQIVYNTLTDDYYCDPLLRRVTNVTVIEIGDERVDGSKINMELLVTGTCQGCDPENVTLFDPDGVANVGRLLQEVDTMSFGASSKDQKGRALEACFCDADAFESGISEVEFMSIYQRYVEEELPDLFCVESTGTCEFGTTFRAILLVAFDFNSTDITEIPLEYITVLETSLLDSLQALYTEGDGGCNPDFREFTTSTAVLNVDFNPNEYYESPSNGRLLQEDLNATMDDENFTITDAPSFFPSSSPTLAAGDANAIVVVEGICNDCSDTVVFNEWSRLSSSASATRMLQLVNEAMLEPSKCFCPVNTSSTTSDVSANELATGIEEGLSAVEAEEFAIQFVLQLSVEECLATLSEVLEESLLEFYCGTPPTPFPTIAPTTSVAPSAAPTVEFCEIVLDNEFLSHLLVEVFAPDGPISDDEIFELGNFIVETYNDLNNLTRSTCDGSFRQIASFTVDDSLSNRRLKNGESRGLQDSDTQTILYGVDGRCEACASNSILFDTDLSELLFVAFVETNATEDAPFPIEDVSFFQEVDLLECSTEGAVQFEDLVLVEFTSNITSFSDEGIALIEAAFVSAYNELTRSYCDPHRRFITSASVTKIYESRNDTTPFEIQVSAACFDCDNRFRIYDIPTSITEDLIENDDTVISTRNLVSAGLRSVDNQRQLQEEQICTCPASPVGSRAPYESEFIAAYTSFVEDLDLASFESVATCTYGTTFTSGIIVEIEDAEDAEAEFDLEVIAQSFLESIQQFYTNSDERCNSQFVTVDSVTASLRTNGTAVQRRSLSGRMMQTEETEPTFNVSGAPSFAPTFGSVDDLSEGADVVLFVSGVCNDCEEGVSLTSDVSRRRLQVETGSDAESNCYCQPGAVVDNRAPDTNEVSSSLQTQLNQQGSDVTVGTVAEVATADCRLDSVPFETRTTVEVFMSSSASEKLFSRVGEIFRRSYNEVQEDYCDPLLRRIDAVEIASTARRGSGSNGCVSFRIDLRLFGTCRGCRTGTPIYDLSPSTVRKLEEKDSKRSASAFHQRFPSHRVNTHRRLQTEDECFCSEDTLGNRAPTRSEVDKEFQRELEKAKISDVCGTTDEKPPPNVPEAELLRLEQEEKIDPGQPIPPPKIPGEVPDGPMGPMVPTLPPKIPSQGSKMPTLPPKTPTVGSLPPKTPTVGSLPPKTPSIPTLPPKTPTVGSGMPTLPPKTPSSPGSTLPPKTPQPGQLPEPEDPPEDKEDPPEDGPEDPPPEDKEDPPEDGPDPPEDKEDPPENDDPPPPPPPPPPPEDKEDPPEDPPEDKEDPPEDPPEDKDDRPPPP